MATKQEINERNWKKRIKKETGIDIENTIFVDWSWEKMEFIFRKCWWEIIKYCKDNNLELRNIVAITGKDTRKTTVWIIFLWFLKVMYPYLNGFLLRDTLVKATTQMKQQIRKTIGIISNEYGVDNFSDKVQEGNDGFYLIRDKKSKSNQKIELLSFDSIVEIGGFTTNNGKPAVFIYDELQNPNSSHKNIITPKQFLANYKFIEEKNRGIELTTNCIMPKWIPRHIFLSNRYVAHHPLNIFAEEHFAYYDSIEENEEVKKGVRSWMLEDPLNNNFICKYIGKEDVSEEWEDFWGTMIVYASKLSNEILRKDKEWEQDQIRLIERGNEDDLARVIGDIFEGYSNKESTYHYTRKTKITEKQFKNDYAKYVNQVIMKVDLDYSRQIVFNSIYIASKDKKTKLGEKIKVWRCIRDKIVKIKCNGVTDDGSSTWHKNKILYSKILDYSLRIKEFMPHIKKIRIYFDDNSGNVPAYFNFGEYKNSFWTANKIKFKKTYPIWKRPKDVDDMQDTGFVIDIDHPSLVELHEAYKVSKKDFTKKDSPRIELANDPLIDLYNIDDYGNFIAKTFLIHNNVATRKLGGENDW